MYNLPKKAAVLALAALQAPSADNSQPWIFTWDGSCLSIKFDSDRFSNSLLGPNHTATLLSFGALAENMMRVANQIAPNTQFSINTGNELQDCIVANLSRVVDDQIPDDWVDEDCRHTNRLKYKKKKLDEQVLRNISMDTEGHAEAKFICDSEAISDMAKLVEQASSIRFRIREVHEWFNASLRFSKQEVEQGDGLDISTLPLPPGGKQLLQFTSDWRRMEFLNKLGLHRLFSVIESSAIKSAPSLLLISSPEGTENIFNAGRLMLRTWANLNNSGIAAQPYFVVTDMLNRSKNGSLPSHLAGAGKRLEKQYDEFMVGRPQNVQMLFRVGYARELPVRSRRRDLEDFIRYV